MVVRSRNKRPGILQGCKKALAVTAVGAFFYLFGIWANAACQPPKDSLREWVHIDRVIDGDTLRLRDGRHVRLIGVNTPELAQKASPSQPLASQAAAFTRKWLQRSRRVQLVYGAEAHDRYGRVLAHVFRSPSESGLEESLIAAGMGFALAIPPNLAMADCLFEVEARTRQAHRGVWGHAGWKPVSASEAVQRGRSGFSLIRGRITRIDRTSSVIWLELDDSLVLRLAAEDWQFLAGQASFEVGQAVVVRGWLVHRKLKPSQAKQGFKAWWMPVRSHQAFKY